MAYYNNLVPASGNTQSAQLPAFSTDQLQDLYARFIDYTDRKETTVKGYFTCIRQFIKWLELSDIKQPQREDVKAYRDYLANSDLATGTQAQYLRAVKHFFKWTASENIYPNIADNIHGAKIRRDVHRKDAFTREETLEIAETIDCDTETGKRLYAMFLLVFVDGLRTIEIHRANVGDIKNIGGDTFLYIQGKGHDEKDTPKYIPTRTAAAINAYLGSRTDKPTGKSPLFANTSNRKAHDKNGDPTSRIATTTISQMFKKCFVKAGYDSDRRTAHSGRHTAASAAFKNGANIYETQHLMGHLDPATTEIYVHTENQLATEKKYRQRIEDYYFNGADLTPILPELEAEIMTLTTDEQQALLEQIKAQKGA